MGCDIHAYVEFGKQSRPDAEIYWQNFTRNSGPRNYVMFGVLAGLRVAEAQLFEPKGMPEGPLGYRTNEDYWTHVAPEAHPEWADGDDWADLESATRWVESGCSVGERDENGRLKRVSGPDWHSHSWLTADELERALDHYRSVVPKYWPDSTDAPAEWVATLAAMRAFEAAGQQTRVVFWFDN
jgi:hypothetical protein